MGLLLSLAMMFPAIDLLVGPAVPSIGKPLETALGVIMLPGLARLSIAQPVLMGLAGLGTLILLSIGTIAALRASANTAHLGLHCGVISGVFAGLMFYIFLVAPTSTVMSGSFLLSYRLHPGFTSYPSRDVVPFARFALIGELRYLLYTLL